MQTFLPFDDFDRSAEALDNARLGKQRVEGSQILDALLTGRGWIHHPATKMWAGYESALVRYIYAVCDEWTSRGFYDSISDRVAIAEDAHDLYDKENPWWFGHPVFHLTHRSNLVRKDPKHYRQCLPDTVDTIEYLWPDNRTHSFFISKPGLKRIAAGELQDPRSLLS